MRWTQDGRYGRPPRRSRIPDRAGAAVGAVAALPAALPHQLRRSSSERRIKRFHSRLVWRVAAAGPAVAGSPLWAMWGRYLCAEIWRRFKCQSTLSLSLHYVARDIVTTMLGSGLCRAMWDLIGNEFTRPASEQHENIGSHDIVS